ncbi:hypothetical protein QJS04_geneDACA001225 [Acorus gramineus]|uniref:Uncharacterized protein n=1 Tax=Acorus gramineus TaxID=55184 RepID=A0AAV9AEK7_ACOGR|nr:hypothetical protein QJS04_geneDACA001225 [Acorus gramineus]
MSRLMLRWLEARRARLGVALLLFRVKAHGIGILHESDDDFDELDYTRGRTIHKNRTAKRYFKKVLDAKIASEGEGFIKPDSKAGEIYNKLDLKAFKKRFPRVKQVVCKGVIEHYIYIAQELKEIETRFLLMKCFLERSYENYILRPCNILEMFVQDKSWVDELPSMSRKTISDALRHYEEIFRKNPELKNKSKDEKLKMFYDDMIESQMDTKKSIERMMIYG